MLHLETLAKEDGGLNENHGSKIAATLLEKARQNTPASRQVKE